MKLRGKGRKERLCPLNRPGFSESRWCECGGRLSVLTMLALLVFRGFEGREQALGGRDPEISPELGLVAGQLLEDIEDAQAVLSEHFQGLHPGGVNQGGREAIVDLKQTLAPVIARSRPLIVQLSRFLQQLEDAPCDLREDCN